MKKNIKLIGILVFSGLFIFTSCKKEKMKSFDPMGAEVATEEADVHLTSSAYQTEVTKELVSANGEAYYTQGTIEYKIDDQVVATVDFGNAANEKAVLSKGGANSEFNLKKEKGKSKYKKVIVRPLVKTDDCKHIVEGIIKYYDYKTGEYLATIDYGNGACDEWATKSWAAFKDEPAGSKTFSLNDWFKKGGKK